MARDQTDVSGARNLLMVFDANVTNVFNFLANARRFVGRCVINHDDLDVASGRAGTGDRPGQQVRPIMRGYDDTDCCHERARSESLWRDWPIP